MKSLVTAVVVGALSVGVAAACAAAVAPTSIVVGGVPVVWLVAAACFGLNWLAWMPASALRSERFYDLTGSATFLTVVAIVIGALASSPDVALTIPGLLPALLVVVWTLRLGSFLVGRIRRAGKDGRFDLLKASPTRFFVPWTLQGLWVFLTSLAMVVQVTSAQPEPAAPWAQLIGFSLWTAGFVFEVVADRQKTSFAAEPHNAGRFVTTGLWAWSRHPNYFGEILLWTGIFVMGTAAYAGGQWVAVASPLFVFVLLRFVSGVPLLEERADARWGNEAAYVAWRDATPLLFPRPPRR